MIRLGILGASGRMGRELIACVSEDPRFELRYGVVSQTSSAIGLDLGILAGIQPLGIFAGPQIESADVVVDFSLPEAVRAHLPTICEQANAFVCASTGGDETFEEHLRQAIDTLTVFRAANTSVGAALLRELAVLLAQRAPSADFEVLDVHHRFKRDAPSGTAREIAHAMAAAKERDVAAVVHRHGMRSEGEIGIASLRGGSVIGEHDVRALFDDEEISLRHIVHDRRVFARGALEAAAWVAGASRGYYTMRDLVRGHAKQ